MNWPWKEKVVKVKVLPREATKLRLFEWQADQELTNQAARVLRDGTVQLMVAVLHNEHPAFVYSDVGSLEDRAILQARSEGYTLALANLEALGQFQKLKNTPESSFEPEELNQS
jgi:hypothetical protein